MDDGQLWLKTRWAFCTMTLIADAPAAAPIAADRTGCKAFCGMKYSEMKVGSAPYESWARSAAWPGPTRDDAVFCSQKCHDARHPPLAAQPTETWGECIRPGLSHFPGIKCKCDPAAGLQPPADATTHAYRGTGGLCHFMLGRPGEQIQCDQPPLSTCHAREEKPAEMKRCDHGHVKELCSQGCNKPAPQPAPVSYFLPCGYRVSASSPEAAADAKTGHVANCAKGCNDMLTPTQIAAPQPAPAKGPAFLDCQRCHIRDASVLVRVTRLGRAGLCAICAHAEEERVWELTMFESSGTPYTGPERIARPKLAHSYGVEDPALENA